MKRILAMTYLAAVLAACGGDDDGGSATDAAPIHEIDAAPPGPDCFEGTPSTHDELINACPAEGVTRIMKEPDLPLLNDDGSLPPLP